AEWAVRDVADAQFPDGRKEFVLRVAAPQRILGLQGGDRVYRLRPADGLGCRLAQAEVTHLPLPYQFRHGTDGLFNGDVRIDTVLVVNVDVVDPQPSERAFAGLAYMFQAAVSMPCQLRSEPRTKPNFVATLTSSRRPRIALPTNSSLVNGPYASDVSRRLIPRSRARWMVARDSASSAGP